MTTGGYRPRTNRVLAMVLAALLLVGLMLSAGHALQHALHGHAPHEAECVVCSLLITLRDAMQAFAVLLTGVLLHACRAQGTPTGNAPLLPFLTPVFLKVKLSC
ncbi:MAG: hypothetical protein ACOX58_08665 [Christensenellales bacterium]